MSCETWLESIQNDVRDIIQSIGGEPEKVIPLLQEIQKRHGYLPEELLETVAGEIGVPVSDMYGVATFYAQFRFVPQGRYLIRVCKGTACHVAGSDILFSAISEELKVDEGETTRDRLFTLESVACLGCCSLSPVVMLGDKIFGKVTAAKIRKILKGYSNE
ncbi:MAG: NADH-quinone oxidoreductase subunit NuoE [Spirochaetota bacterium]